MTSLQQQEFRVASFVANSTYCDQRQSSISDSFRPDYIVAETASAGDNDSP
jgi:hypothetical protein